MTGTLSPAAQAVLDAYADLIQTNPHGYRVEHAIAAALYAAAHHLNHDRRQLAAIAAELEGSNAEV